MSINNKRKKRRQENFLRKVSAFFAVGGFVLAVTFATLIIFDLIGRYFYYSKGRVYSSQDSQGRRTGLVLAEETENLKTLNKESYASENYRIVQVTFGGDAVLLPSGEEQLELEIYDIKSELLTTKDQEDIKLLVSWKTQRPTVSEVEYYRGGEEGGKKIKEDKYGYSHSAVLNSLDAATTYTYVIRVKDEWGNEKSSDKFAFYTGAPNVSLLDLLAGAVRDVFGWAMK